MSNLVLKRAFSSSTRVQIILNTKPNSYETLNKRLDDAASNSVQNQPVAPFLVKSFPESSTYDPFDFSYAKLQLDKRNKEQPALNTFDKRKLNPLDYYTNPEYLSSNYVSSTGRIFARDVTKLSVKNQKRLAKAIKRSRDAGLLSSVSKSVSLIEFGKSKLE